MPLEHKRRIVVVDDEEYICRIIDECLGHDRFDILTFSDPELALGHIADNPVDLVLTDLVMGEHSGLQILEGTLEEHPDAIVILMTAHPTVKTAISVLKKGAYDFLVKPFKLELLKNTVDRGLAHQKIVQDNLTLKGQVEFLKVANSFFGTGIDIDKYLEMVLRSCNTEMAAEGSAIIECDPDGFKIARQIAAPAEGDVATAVMGRQLLEQFQGRETAAPRITITEVKIDGRVRQRILISQPMFIRRQLCGVINCQILCNSDHIPSGRLDILSILAGSAASAIANQNLYQDVRRSYLQAIRALTNSIEARDQYTAGHTDRVTRLAEAVARQIGWDEKQIMTLQVGCALHDIGKIGVPDSVLNKAGKLTDKERKLMMKHPQLGHRIVRGIDLFKPSLPYIIAHHERYDGQGYPKGLKGDEIPIEGRLLAVADTLDAIMSDRPYRKGADLDTAVYELVSNKGTQFDPDLVDALIAVMRSGAIDFAEFYGRDLDLSCLDRIDLIETELV